MDDSTRLTPRIGQVEDSASLTPRIGKVEDSTRLTPRIGKVATRELARHGITQYDDLTTHTPRGLLAIHGVGPKAVRILADELASRGQSFATTPGDA